MEKFFKLGLRGTDKKTEIIAGLTTFMTMAYVLAVQPAAICGGEAYITDVNGVVITKSAIMITCALVSGLITLLMAFYTNFPFALSTGMGSNFILGALIQSQALSFGAAMAITLISGIVFVLLTVFGLRDLIVRVIPKNIKIAISASIGFFIAYLGFKNCGIGSFENGIALGNLTDPAVLLAIGGLLLIIVLNALNVKGAILYGIILTWVLGIICELTGIYVPDAEAGMYSVIPTAFVSFDFSSLGNTFGQVFNLNFTNFNIGNFIVVMFAFLFVDLFDTLGTLIGVASKADMLDEEGKLPRIKGALLADAIATSAGAVLGTSTTTTYVESASGVTEGGRTGLTAATTAVLFLLASIFSPLFLTIPSFATAPALIVVGFYMMGAVAKINFDDMTDAIPAFLTILVMPLAYSISEGIAIGVVSWTLINLLSGKAKEKKITPLMYVLTVLFILKYIFL